MEEGGSKLHSAPPLTRAPQWDGWDAPAEMAAQRLEAGVAAVSAATPQNDCCGHRGGLMEAEVSSSSSSSSSSMPLPSGPPPLRANAPPAQAPLAAKAPLPNMPLPLKAPPPKRTVQAKAPQPGINPPPNLAPIPENARAISRRPTLDEIRAADDLEKELLARFALGRQRGPKGRQEEDQQQQQQQERQEGQEDTLAHLRDNRRLRGRGMF